MHTSYTSSCYIIGEGILPIQCAEILLDREHTICGMICSDRVVHDWARGREIPHIDPESEDIVAFLSQHPFDYLFSIVNQHILSERILEVPRRCAINFHDAPLPRYSGSYATSWAIIQGEKEHGVTWHAVTELVDGGDIFKQSLFEIDSGETAFTLNVKCYDAAIDSFAELIDDIACDRVSAKKQNLDERTFFARKKRPSPGCLLSWNRSARDIGALVRALDFRSYPNPLGLPKLAIGMDFIIVPEVEVLNSMSAVPPGTITHIDPGFVRVSAIDGEIELHRLLTIDGQSLPISDFVATFGLYVGYQFKELDQETANRIAALDASMCQHEAYWARRLETLAEITLPYLHGKSSHVHPARYSYVPMPVPGEILNYLENRDATCRIEHFLLAAFAAYLARMAGVWVFDIGYRDIELKSVVADIEGMVAAYVPLRVNIDYKQSFEEVSHAVQKQVQQVHGRKTYARDIVVRYPVLRSRTNLQGTYLPSIFVEQAETLHDYKPPQGSELTLVIRKGGVECLWVYNAEVIDAESVVRLQQQFTTFLQAIVSNPQQHISELSLLTKAEQYRLLVEWNATETAYPKDKCLHQLFEEQVERTPEAVAVVFEEERMTYQELNQRANQLAHHLRARGVGPDVLVGICVERSLDMLVGLLGILKAGGAYVPLDPGFPSERIAFMLEDAGAPVLVTQQHLISQLPKHGAKVVCLDRDQMVLSHLSEANLLPEATFANLAYVIYTSGSTGRPKGVQIIHRAVVNFLLSMRQQPGLIAEDTLLAITTLSFDIAALELFLPLIVGARVVVAGREVVADGAALTETLSRTGTTVMQATPVTWRIMLAAGWQGKLDLKILCGGEALPLELAQQLLPKAASLWNLYGPTETTIWSTLSQIEPGAEAISIGHPIANTQIYLLDAHLQLVPVGVPGELFIGGDGLAHGYLNRPELTAERFIPHPFSDRTGARLYKTGDLARYRPDGTIEHLGRLDFQVKLRGFRIELGEIEAVLAQHPAVQQAVVVAREDVPGDKRLAAYVVQNSRDQDPDELNEGATEQPSQWQEMSALVPQLRTLLKERLPDYMLPATIMLMDALPLTPNGKVDRKALPAPKTSTGRAKDTFVAPMLPLHHQLVQIWEDLLGVRPIGVKDDFFDLGGHSLLAIRLIGRITQICGKKLPLATLFADATIEHLATALMAFESQINDSTLGTGATKEHLATELVGEETKTDARAPIVTVQVGGFRRPFFYLHGDWRGGAYYSKELARSLGPDQPFYLLEPYKFAGLSVPPSFEVIAAAHLKTLRAVQPEGPYRLGGWCNGGLIAYEMARQLHAQGQKVDLLVLMDPDAPTRLRRVRRVISRFGNFMRIQQEKQFEWFLRLHHIYRYLRFSHYRESKNSELLETTEQDEVGYGRGKVGFTPPSLRLKAMVPKVEILRQDYPQIYDWVVSDYTPDLFPGKITFFWTSEEAWRPVGWQKIVKAKEGEVEIHTLPGNHITGRTEHLQVLAEHLSDCVNKIQEPVLI